MKKSILAPPPSTRTHFLDFFIFSRFLRFKNFGYCSVLLLTALNSCKEENLDLESNQNYVVETANYSRLREKANNEMFVFRNYSDFIKVQDSVGKDLKSEILSSQIKNKFITLFELYSKFDEKFYENQITKIEKNIENLNDNLSLVYLNGDKHILKKVSDNNLAKLLNSDRKVLIGDIIYKFDYDSVETLELRTGLVEVRKIVRKHNSESKNAKIASGYYADQYYSYNGRDYKIVLSNEYYTYCGAVTNGAETNGYISAIHSKKFLGTYFTNKTNFVNVSGSGDAGYPDGNNYANGCYGCGINYTSLNSNNSCTNCSESNINIGYSGCYKNFNGLFAAFNCDDGVARQLYL